MTSFLLLEAVVLCQNRGSITETELSRLFWFRVNMRDKMFLVALLEVENLVKTIQGKFTYLLAEAT